MYYNERQSKEYVEKIRQILKHKQVRYNEIHKAILKLRPEHILTTNYDDLLDQAIQAGAYPFSIVSRDNQFPYSRNVSLLVKIHGDLEDENFVLKEDDYLEYATRYPLIEAFIKSVFTSKVVLFVGYSFSDPNLKMILQTVRNILGQHYQNAYLLSIDEQLHSSQREYLKQKGVIAINYTDADTEERKFMDDYLKGKNAVKKKSKIEGQRLSSHGQKLLDFLRFINVYDPFIEALSQKNIVLQQYESLKRFEELPVLTADFMANLYPFNTSDQRIHNWESYVLESTNNELTNFYFQNAQKQENLANSIPPLYRPNPESKTYNEELYVIKKLRSAFVEYIKKKNGGHVRIQSSEDISECECFRCLFYNLRWGDLIERVDRYEVTTTSLLGEDTLAAYANYKLSNYKKAIQQFEKIALKAWRTDKASTYFLATQNIKHLQRLGFWEGIETDKIGESDIEQVFYQLHNIDDDQRELLKLIKENKIVHRAEWKIDDLLVKILEVRDLYKRGGIQHFGPVYYEDVQQQLGHLLTFYTKNCLVFDEYSDFKRVCGKGIEALIANHAIHSSYQNRIEKFDSLFFIISLFYLNTEALKKIRRKYEIDKLPATSEGVQTLVTRVNNLLCSGKAAPGLFSNESMNEFLEVQFAKGRHLKRTFYDIFNKGFLLLSSVDLEEEQVTELLGNVLHFLRVEKEVLGPQNVGYVGTFIVEHSEFVSYEQCVELLEIGTRKPIFFNNNNLNGLMWAVNYVVKTHFTGKTLKDNLTSKILHLLKANYLCIQASTI